MNKTSRQYRKIRYYLNNYLQFALLPGCFFRRRLEKVLGRLTPENREEIIDRVNYYNKLTKAFDPGPEAIRARDLRPGKKNSYVFDLHRTLRYFDPDFRFSRIFGDVTIVPETPKVVRSRPIHGDNRNSVLMKLDEIRHFYFVKDEVPFDRKQDRVVWRGAIGNKKKGRIELMERHAANPICDIGYSKTRRPDDPYKKDFMSIRKQLGYKFVLSIEGNDVASNLKWIMSSNSLCLMPEPKYETWFMEGRLIPDHHYARIESDYSDLDEKVRYYTQNPEDALRIIRNAHEFVETFKDKQREELISVLVMLKYFELSGQLSGTNGYRELLGLG